MSDVMRSYPTSPGEYEEAIDKMLAEMRTIGEQIQQAQCEIEQIRCESDPVSAEIRLLLVSMGKPV